MTRLATLATVLLLAACPLQKSGGTTTIGGPSSGGSTTGGGGSSVAPDAMITMPDLTGKSFEEASALVRDAGFQHGLEKQPLSCDGPEQTVGHVDCQTPEPGKSVKAYTLVRVNLKEGERLSGMFLRRHFDKLKGMSLDKAKAQAKADGHTGEIRIQERDTFLQGCAENTVCAATDERGGQSGMDSKDALILQTNKTLSIAPPPD